MKIAHVMAGAAVGGAETFFVRLCLALHRAGEEVFSAIRTHPARAAELRAGGLAPREFRFGGPLDVLTKPRLRRALKNFAPAIVVAWMNRAARKTPTGPWLLAGRLGGYYDLANYRHCDRLIGNTRGIVRWATEQGWPADRIDWLPNFSPDLAGGVPLARTAPRVLLAMGRLHRNKGFDVAIRALARMPLAELWLAGEGPERAVLETLARGEGVAERVRWLGWRNDQAALLASADLLLCPSRHEPLGNVVLEAWSAARPVVAAAAQGPSELIAHGATGLLVPMDDATALADAANSVLEDSSRAASLGQRGRAEYEAHFTEAAVVQRWQGWLRRAVHEGRA
jgi:glycosyltransferase involved in cell wall biosynthesis